MSWTRKTIASPIPKELQGIAASVDSVASSIDAVLGTIKSLLEAAKIFFLSASDQFKAFAGPVIAELEAIIDNLFGSGLYMLQVSPFTVARKSGYDPFGFPLLTPRDAIISATSSFDDEGDENRPDFGSSGIVSLLGIMVSVPDAQQFYEIIKKLLAIFDIGEIQELVFRIENLLDFRSRASTPTAQPTTPPDWVSYKLNNIQILKDTENALLDGLQTFKGLLTVPDTIIEDIINTIENKLAVFNNVAKQLRDISFNVGFASGIYTTTLSNSGGGNAALKEAIQDPALGRSTNGYTYMLLFVSGGEAAPVVGTLNTLLGL